MNTNPATGRRTLVIDDDAIMREVLGALLTGEGYAVRVVESGEAALDFLRDDSAINVLLCDMQLPGLEGAALFRELRRAAPQARLVGMSAGEPQELDRKAADAFLRKPFSMEQFADALLAASHAEHASPGKGDPSSPDATEVLNETTFASLAARIPAQMAELCQLTLSDIATRLQRLHSARESGDEAVFRQEAHALKGGCGMVGATELAALAARAETGSLNDTPAHADFAAAAERLRSIMAARST